VIRDATDADLDVVADLEDTGLGVDAWSRSLVAEGVAGRLPTISYLVMEQEGEVVGYAVASIVADIAELQRIVVASGHRRAGVATALLDEVVVRARREGADRLLLEVREHNTGALDLYARSRFVEIARRPRYYRDGTAAVVLARDLAR